MKYGNGSMNQKGKKNAIKKIKTLYESPEKVIKLFNNYSKIASKAKYRSIHGDELKILTAKQIA